MSAVKTVIVDELDILKVPLVKINPPDNNVITDCISRILVFAVPLFTVIPPPNAVDAVAPLIVFDVAPVNVTLPVPWLNVPSF